MQLSLHTGYERQDLNWSIAGNSAGANPNIYSELKWKNVGGQSIGASLTWKAYHKLFLLADYTHTFLSAGNATDIDYSSDNRTSVVYNQAFNADKGYNRQWATGVGYEIVSTDFFSLIPYLGYGVSRQSLHLLDNTGNFPDLNSTYQANWKGPFIRANALLKITRKLKAAANVTYNQVNYNATADWNLVQDFAHPVSYTHTAKGYGIDGSANLTYDLTPHIAVNIEAGYFTFHTGKGIDELFLAEGGSDKTQLNGVNRNGFRFSGGLIFSY